MDEGIKRKNFQKKLDFTKANNKKIEQPKIVVEEDDIDEEDHHISSKEPTTQILRGSSVDQHGKLGTESDGEGKQKLSSKLPLEVWQAINTDIFKSDSPQRQLGVSAGQCDRTGEQRLRTNELPDRWYTAGSHRGDLVGGKGWFADSYYESDSILKGLEFLLNERYLPTKKYLKYEGSSQKKLTHFYLRYEFDGKGKLGDFENAYNTAARLQASNSGIPISGEDFIKNDQLKRFSLNKLESQGYLQVAFFNPKWVPNDQNKNEPKFLYIRYYLAKGKLWQANQLADCQSGIDSAINPPHFLVALLRCSSSINSYYDEFIQAMPDLRRKQYYNSAQGFIKSIQMMLITGFISNATRFTIGC